MRTRPLALALLVALGPACGGAGPTPDAPPGGLVRKLAQSAGTQAPAPKRGATITSTKAPPRADATLLARHVLFANPDRTMPSVSPDGKHVAWLGDVGGVLEVWVAPASDPSKGRPVTSDKKRGIRWYTWAQTSQHLVFRQDDGGDVNWHLHAVDLKTGAARDLTPLAGIAARLEATSFRKPTKLVVGLNDRDKRWHDLHEIDVVTGERKLLQQNEGFSSFDLDLDLKVRLARRPEKDGGFDVQEPDGRGGFRSVFRVAYEDAAATRVVGFDAAGKKAFLLDSRGRDTAAFVELDLATKKPRVLLDDGQADVDRLVLTPRERKVQAALSNHLRRRWHVLDPSLRADLDVLEAASPGDVEILGRSNDDKTWMVGYTRSDAPASYALYDRAKKKVKVLFTNAKALENAKLAPMMPVVIEARDGLPLVSYLTLPAGQARANGDLQPERPLPMVLLVHGGPWSRDEWGLSRQAQWLASRGYAVLSVNFRGSRGFGKRFLNAADHEWAGKMHEDLLDAVTWAVDRKIADPSKVAIMGGSYGGYATLVGLAFTPDRFACGVDIVGPSNLETLLRAIPAYWESEIESLARRVGDHRTEEGRKLLAERSPLGRAASITRPLLIGQGKNDPRVKQSESDAIVQAMQGRGVPVTYALYPDEGHGFARPENRISFNAVAEVFLAQCLGGPFEPYGADLTGASLTVPTGKEHVEGLPAALAAATSAVAPPP